MSSTIILDCDPGIDDALAIAFAVGSPGDRARRHHHRGRQRRACQDHSERARGRVVHRGLRTCRSRRGAPRPLLRADRRRRRTCTVSPAWAARCCRRRPARPKTGTPSTSSSNGSARRPGEITLVATGPLTNIGLALRREPRLAQWVRDFVIMGGSAVRGNVTPAAEFNIWADPEAAAIVFGAGWTVRMIGLDVTLRARATAAVQQRMRDFGKLGTRPGAAGARAVPTTRHDGDRRTAGARRVRDRVHRRPQVFTYTPAPVEVETTGR